MQQIYPKQPGDRPAIESTNPFRSPTVGGLTDAEFAKIKIGDIIGFDLDPTDGKHIPDHSTIVTRTPTDGGYFGVTYHTFNTTNRSLAGIIHNYHPVYIWILPVRNSWAP